LTSGNNDTRVGLVSTRVQVLAGLVLLATMAWALTGFPLVLDASRLAQYGVSPDIFHERVMASEALIGDPYRPLQELMAQHEFPSTGGVTARPPSTLLLQLPLLAVSERLLFPFAMVVVLGSLVMIGWQTGVLSNARPGWLLWLSPLVFTLPVLSSLSYLPVFGLLAVFLILTAWGSQDATASGLALGVATSLRLWPALVVVGFFLAGRKKAAAIAGGTFVSLNLIGLLLPGVSLEGSLLSLVQGADDWLYHNQNASAALIPARLGIPAFLSIGVVVALSLALALRFRHDAIPITLIAALLASPLSWPAYVLAALPVGALFARRVSGLPVAILIAALLSWRLIPPSWIGRLHFLVLLTLLMLVAASQWRGGLSDRQHPPAGLRFLSHATVSLTACPDSKSSPTSSPPVTSRKPSTPLQKGCFVATAFKRSSA